MAGPLRKTVLTFSFTDKRSASQPFGVYCRTARQMEVSKQFERGPLSVGTVCV